MTTEIQVPSDEKVEDLLSDFKAKYHQTLAELDALKSGTFDDDESSSRAAMCLLAQAAILDALAAADLKARSLKRDIDFAKATAYADIKSNPPDGKKPTEPALKELITLDAEVRRIGKEHIEAERDHKHLSNIHALLKEAHITFRSIKKVT